MFTFTLAFVLVLVFLGVILRFGMDKFESHLRSTRSVGPRRPRPKCKPRPRIQTGPISVSPSLIVDNDPTLDEFWYSQPEVADYSQPEAADHSQPEEHATNVADIK